MNELSNVGVRLYRDQKSRSTLLSLLGICFAIIFIVSLAIGPTGITFDALPRAVSAAIGSSDDPLAERDRLVLFDIRLPRSLLGAFIGAALAIAGATMQGLFRNPLADPGLIGVSSGAALAAVATIAFGSTYLSFWTALFGIYALPCAAMVGGLATTSALVVMTSRGRQLETATLLLAGIAIAALANAATGFISYLSDDRQLRDLTLWSMGSLSGASWSKVAAIIPLALGLLVLLPFLSRPLNALLLGEAEAFHLGVDVENAKRMAIATTAISVGAAVAVAGIVGFIGLIVPHLIRLIAGPDHRIVLPAGAILGACLVLIADMGARMLVAPAELPLGIVMAAIGAPIFMHLVVRRGAAAGGI